MPTHEQILEYKKHYREKNQEKIKKYRTEYNEKNREQIRKHNKEYNFRKFKSDANITFEQFNEMYDKQEGKCRICGRHQTELKRRLSVDHNHTTGKIRGLLCGKCNFMLGYASDDITLLSNAIKYINDTN